MTTPFPRPGALSEAARRAHRWAQWTRQIQCRDPEEEAPPLRNERKVIITINHKIEIHHDRPDTEESND
jgi:hypothetical protein